jgi:hypothetical protein
VVTVEIAGPVTKDPIAGIDPEADSADSGTAVTNRLAVTTRPEWWATPATPAIPA